METFASDTMLSLRLICSADTRVHRTRCSSLNCCYNIQYLAYLHSYHMPSNINTLCNATTSHQYQTCQKMRRRMNQKANPTHTPENRPGSGCSKLTTSLVNVSLNFQKLISQICQYFCCKNVRSFCIAKDSLISSKKKNSVYLVIHVKS